LQPLRARPALESLRTLSSLGTSTALRPGHARGTHDSLRALRAGVALGSLGTLGAACWACDSLRALGTWRARDSLRARRAGGALRADVALRALRALACACSSACSLGPCGALRPLWACLTWQTRWSCGPRWAFRPAAALRPACSLQSYRPLGAYADLRAQTRLCGTRRPTAAGRALRTLGALRARTAIHGHRLPVALSADRGMRTEPAPALWPKGSANCLVAPVGSLRTGEGDQARRRRGMSGVRLCRFRGRRHQQRGHGEQGGSTGELRRAVGVRPTSARVLTPTPLPHPVRDPRLVRMRIAPLPYSSLCVTGIVTDCHEIVTVSYNNLNGS
jgi:hypothetical protein